ncbi:MAG: HAMP domain-containing sensor histidine kinase [Gallionella sp.]|nr:HAMP domain-containing sensor histidine kinase [Gallionella sp.]
MKTAPSTADQSAQTEQRKTEKLFAKIFIVGGAGASIASLVDSSSGLFTPWDNYGAAITSFLYFVTGLIILLRPKWLTAAVMLSMIPTVFYHQGVMFMAVHYPSEASLYSAASSGPFFPLLYVALFITLPKGAATISWINCAGFYLQFMLNATLFAELLPSPGRVEGEHLLVEAMMAHPAYIVALSYIVKLRERLHTTQQEAFQHKEDFLAMLSHEIRNLLQTMVGAIELLDLKLKEPAERRSVARLQKAATQLQTYLSDINELTRLEDPALKVKKGQFDLAQLLNDVRDEWLPQAESQGLQLAVDIRGTEGGHSLFIDTDEARLRQIVSNLVSNALKYTEEGGVTITAIVGAESPNCTLIDVVDTGIGIEEKYFDRIFQPYVRLESAKKLCSEGSGLGLTIVERLVESIGGSLQVESQLGRGTRFQVTVPGLVAQSVH